MSFHSDTLSISSSIAFDGEHANNYTTDADRNILYVSSICVENLLGASYKN